MLQAISDMVLRSFNPRRTQSKYVERTFNIRDIAARDSKLLSKSLMKKIVTKVYCKKASVMSLYRVKPMSCTF